MRVKIIQCDTRDIVVQLKSKNLYYGKASEYDYESLMRNNNNDLFHPENALSLCCLVTMMKCKMISLEYEFVKGNADDWEFPKIHNNANVYSASGSYSSKRAVPWLKPKTLFEQMSADDNKSVDIFCILDTDAWIRDEHLFLEFLETFSKNSATLAMAEDLDRSSKLNSGFIAVKNNEKGKHIFERINNDPKYERYYKVAFHEQAALCDYYLENKEDFMVLPLNDYNTPCGRIVRHAWLHGLFYNLVVDEVIAVFTKLSLSFMNDSTYRIRNGLVAYSN